MIALPLRQDPTYRIRFDDLETMARELDGFDRWTFLNNMRQLDATLEFDMSDGKPRGTPQHHKSTRPANRSRHDTTRGVAH